MSNPARLGLSLAFMCLMSVITSCSNSDSSIDPGANGDHQSQDQTAPGQDGCMVQASEKGVQNVSIRVGKSSRTMIRVVSPTYTNTHKYALIIGYHGLGLDGNSPRIHHKWPIVEELGKDEALFIYPNAQGGSWNAYPGSPDLDFFDAIVAATSAEYCIDRNRIFVHGFSNGGFFVNALSAARPSAIRGVISVAGGGGGTSKPAMIIHGQYDNNVGYYPYAPDLVNCYATANGCHTGKFQCIYYRCVPDP